MRSHACPLRVQGDARASRTAGSGGRAKSDIGSTVIATVARDPVEVRARRPTALPDRADDLTRRDRVAGGDVHPAQMEVAGDQPAAVVEVDRVAPPDRIAPPAPPPRGRPPAPGAPTCAGEIGAEVPARDVPVELPPGPVHARDPARPGPAEPARPEARRVVRAARRWRGSAPARARLAPAPRCRAGRSCGATVSRSLA